MKNIIKLSGLIVLILLTLLIYSCKKEEKPVLTTTAITAITQTTATAGGNVTSDGGATVTARGVCWSTTTGPTTALSSKPTDGTGTGIFTSSITGLTTSTVYYVRAYATNSAGTAYGNEITFTTKGATGTVMDIDGNTYSTIVIGTQTWMSENLKTTKLRNGNAIPLVTYEGDWAFLMTYGFGYCWYNNDAATYKSSYGALYTWSVASSGNICPEGWSLPSNSDWSTLITYLGGITNAGDKLREEGIIHWGSSNSGATNESGFTALPGRGRASSGQFLDINSAYFWSDQESSGSDGYYQTISSSGIILNRHDPKGDGLSVRCIKK